MSDGFIKKRAYEHERRPAAGTKDESQGRFRDGGANFYQGGFRPGGPIRINQIKFAGEPISYDPRQLYMEDINSLLGTLEGWRFTINGEIGTIGRLRKIPEVAALADELFRATRQSILKMNKITQLSKHPDKDRSYNVMEFQCFLPPADPFPEPIFKKHLAFSVKLPGPLVSTD